jgi:hypothetical protein
VAEEVARHYLSQISCSDQKVCGSKDQIDGFGFYKNENRTIKQGRRFGCRAAETSEK